MDIIEYISGFFEFLTAFPSYVLVPIFLMALSLVAGLKKGEAFKAGLAFGTGFFLLLTTLFLFIDTAGPLITEISALRGIELPIVDDGDMAALTFIYAWGYHAIGIPLGLLTNIPLLLIGYTKTYDIDIWNFWNWASAASITYVLTGSWTLGWLAFFILQLIALKMADLTAERIQKQFNLPDTVSFPHVESQFGVPVAYVMDKIYDRIPGLKDIEATPKTIRKRVGLLGDPIIIAMIIGIAFSAIAGYEMAGILETGVIFAAVMWLFPKCTGRLMEGLAPIADAVRVRVTESKFFKGKKFYIGLDSYLCVGYEEVMATGMLLIPLGILIFNTGILPWNNILVVTSIGWWAGNMIFVVATHRGNILRSLITGVIVEGLVVWLANIKAVAYTATAIASGIEIPAGVLWTNACTDGGWDFIALIIHWVTQLIG